MRSGPLHVVHLFSRTADGFLVRLWLDVLAQFDPREFRFSVVLPEAIAHSVPGIGESPPGAHRAIEIPALAGLKHPAYYVRSHLSLRSRFSGETVHIVHSHFPGACVLAGRLGGPFSPAGHVTTPYSFAGPWRTERPPALLLRALRHTARRVERVVCVDGEDEARILDLAIAKKYQTTLLPLPVPTVEEPQSGRGQGSRARLAEDLELPDGARWAGVFLPTSSRRDLRNIMMDLAPLSELDSDLHLLFLVPALRLGDARSLLLRLRLGERFHVPGDLRVWERLLPHLEVAVLPCGGLAALAAALLALGAHRPVWTPAGATWMHLLPGVEAPSVTMGQAYRMKEEIRALISAGPDAVHAEHGGGIPAETRPDNVAERLETVYRDVLAERVGAAG